MARHGSEDNMKQGIFITFEGSEGCGKSTQAKMLVDYLIEQGHKAKIIREPGGVTISEKVRDILLDKENTQMSKECETLLYMAARAQLVEEVIIPEIEQGTIVICDRFLDSTLAYQGYGCGVDIPMIREIGAFATKHITPAVTFFLDLDVEEGLRRRGSERDRIELRSVEYHNKVRQGYLDIAKKEPKRVKVIPGSWTRERIFEDIMKHVKGLLAK